MNQKELLAFAKKAAKSMKTEEGLSDFVIPRSHTAVYPQTHIQLCIVHMVRSSMKFVPWRYYKEVASDLKSVCRSAIEEEAVR